MTETAVEKARKTAEAAAAKLAEAERQEAEIAAQKAAQRVARQRELDTEFLAHWDRVDAELMDAGSKSAADAVYEGSDPVAAVAVFWVARAKRNTVRQHARMAYFRVHGEHPADNFAMELSHRDMMIADRLEEAISGAANRHAGDLADELEAKWTVGSDG
ncbi:hypothetical protein AR457_23155 [Streptomyces agglomeratus]|uniref:hypothetical protein n=1 Tax=Streptomyces agglomeratus TaxID=285458 RepID=UPI00085467AE|nr:hypothetical protein [Streptomyces agglomeratus]OEJ39025.1 hypothetical protein BGK70_13500 [Streptomyces agglomeratus]OEJ46594.1 hypothetical protein AR457_23155 [Streptomyces agglomeratus]